jgi:hypothetical protein
LPHLITDIALTSSVESDQQALGEIQPRQAESEVAPERRLVDEGYVSGPTLAASQKCGEDLVGPAPGAHSPQSRLEDGITLDQFELKLEEGLVHCPGGQQAVGRQAADGSWHFKFETDMCAECPLRLRCCTGEGGRSLTVGPNYAELQAARLRQKTETFKEEYRQHRGGIEGCLSALVRGHHWKPLLTKQKICSTMSGVEHLFYTQPMIGGSHEQYFSEYTRDRLDAERH